MAVAAIWLPGAVERFLYGDATILSAGTSPGTVAVSPDGKTIYVANSIGGITPASAATGKASRPIRIKGSIPYGCGTSALAITPDNRTLFTTVVGDDGGRTLPMARVDLATDRETGQVKVPGGVSDFIMSRDGTTVYVISGHNELFVVNAGTDRLERRIPVPPNLLGSGDAMVLSPDSQTMYIASSREGNDSDSTGAVTAINLRTAKAGPAISVGWEPVALAITPNGRTLYAAIDGMHGADGPESPERVVAIDTATNRITASIPWRVPPCYLAMAPRGNTLWVASTIGSRRGTADNTVTPIAVISNQPGRAFRTSGWLNEEAGSPTGLAISPDGRTLYVAVVSGLEIFRITES
jgi:DNA-binding beta-propeller fold protein YncE